MKNKQEKSFHIMGNRLFIVYLGIWGLFMIIVGKFYQLQIIDYDQYSSTLNASVERQIETDATRGLIFDRYGRPLAINQPINVIKFDQQVRMQTNQLNQVLLGVIEVLEENGDTYIDDLPISYEAPFVYTGTKTAINQFMYSIPYDSEEHRQSLLLLSADEIIDYLRSSKVFNIEESISDEDARKIIALRVEIYGDAYKKYNLVTLANDVTDQTVAYLAEHHMDYPGVTIEVEPIRYYSYGESMGSILGYTRTITDSQYQEMEQYGYNNDDIVGHDGIENSMEPELRGEKGYKLVEVDNMGRIVHTVEEDNAVSGNDIFLTIDVDLQVAAYESIEKRLAEAIVERLSGRSSKTEPITSQDIIVSMLESSQLDLREMQEAKDTSIQAIMYNRLMSLYNGLDDMVKQNITPIEFLIQVMEEETGEFTEKEILVVFDEQGKIDLDEQTINNFIEDPTGTTESTLIKQLQEGKLKVNQFAVKPFSASSVVIDVNTGEVLSMVGYPYADSNEMTMNFNAYYSTLFDDRSMLWNRALMTAKAPGSTFKMVSSIAGLEEGVVTPQTQIFDTGIYEKAGIPAPRCWIHTSTGGGHGNVNMTHALEVSCNYYYYELAFLLGQQSNEQYAGIDALTKYAEMLGLGEKTGIELPEISPNVSTPSNLVKNQLTSVFSRLRNVDDEGRVVYTENTTDILENNLYPYENNEGITVEEQIDYLIQYELKRNIEPILDDIFVDDLSGILDDAYSRIQMRLQAESAILVDEILKDTLADESSQSLKNKTKMHLEDIISSILENSMDDQILKALKEVDVYDILDCYEYAYNVVYNREVNKNSQSDVVLELRRRLEEIENQETIYLGYVLEKVRESIISGIASNLISDLDLDWQDGTTVRTAIGQGQNAFTPLQIARYVAAVANGEEVYEARIIAGINDTKGSQGYQAKESVVYNTLELSENTIEVVHEGMYLVTNGNLGSARNQFRDFEIEVAAKTGTAQEGTKTEHSWFVGFAPYDDPEIAFVTAVYDADGLGTYGQLIAKDILIEYFDLEKEQQKTTLESTFIE